MCDALYTLQLDCVICCKELLYVPGGHGRGSCLQSEQLQQERRDLSNGTTEKRVSLKIIKKFNDTAFQTW